MEPRPVLIVAPPLVTLLDVTGPWEVFRRAEGYVPGTYQTHVVRAEGAAEVGTKFGLAIVCPYSVFDFTGPLDTVLVAGSEQGVSGDATPEFLEWLRDAASRTRRMGSVCTGAFYLAAAGLLDGKRATSHWRHLDRLARTYPAVAVEPDPIYVRDGAIYTSAGITAGIDLALALVEDDLGSDVAQGIARDLVVFVQRPAGQKQISSMLAARMADRDPIRELQRWAADHLTALTSVDDMAAHVHMSPRHFARLFTRETGVTPGRYLRQLREEAARRRLHETHGATGTAAADTGYRDARALRRSLRRKSTKPS